MLIRTLFQSFGGAFNSATKYPSILTYHAMGDKGCLSDALTAESDGPLILTEKVDGTNVRIIIAPDGSLAVGSREEILYIEGDLLHLPDLGIVDALQQRDLVPEFDTSLLTRFRGAAGTDAVTIIYGELFGGNIGRAAREYTESKQEFMFRAFDVVRFPLSAFEEVCAKPRDQISAWRESGGQPFLPNSAFEHTLSTLGLPITPRIPLQTPLPTVMEETAQWLTQHMPVSTISGKKAEGLVVRSPARSFIVKLRHEDYTRTLRRKKT